VPSREVLNLAGRDQAALPQAVQTRAAQNQAGQGLAGRTLDGQGLAVQDLELPTPAERIRVGHVAGVAEAAEQGNFGAAKASVC